MLVDALVPEAAASVFKKWEHDTGGDKGWKAEEAGGS